MKKPSEFTGKAATDLIGHLLLSVAQMLGDERNKKAYAENGAAALIGSALINTPDSIVGLLATLNEVPVDQYEYNAVSLVKDAYALLTDPEMLALFNSQG